MLAALLIAAALLATIAVLARVLAGRPAEFRWSLHGEEPQWDCPPEWQCPSEDEASLDVPLPLETSAESASAAPAEGAPLSLEQHAESAGTRS